MNSNERIYRALQNWAEFGIWLSGGLFCTFVSRQIPAFRIVQLLAYLGFVAFAYLNRSSERRFEMAAIALALLLSLIGGLWDFVRDLLLWAVAPFF